MRVSSVSSDELTEIFHLEQAIEVESAASLATLRARRQMFADGFLAVSKHDRIVGYLESCLWNLDTPEFNQQPDFFSRYHRPDGQKLYIIFLGVAPDQRRQGAARLALEAAKAVAHRYNALSVQAVTRAYLSPLYLKAGFRAVHKIPHFLPDKHEYILMECEVGTV